MKNTYYFTIFAGVMRLNRNCLRLALINSGVTALLSVAVLGLIMQNITGLTPSIILVNGLISFLLMVPAYYVSFINHWNEGSVFSIRRFYTPLLICLVLLVPSLIYASLAFGYNWRDYYYLDGSFNSDRIFTHLLALFVPIFLLHIIQMLAISNERQVIINASMLNIPKKLDTETVKPVAATSESELQLKSEAREVSKVITLRGNTKTETSLEFNIDQLFYVESDANYLKVALYENDKLAMKSIRLTIKQFEETVHEFPQLMRCHRAYVVNMNHVTYYQGTVSKGELHFDMIKDVIPVSKTYATAIFDNLHEASI